MAARPMPEPARPDGAPAPEGLVSIVIPHYRTEDMMRLCLRAIRRFTPPPYEVVVVDNNSADASLDYLRGLGWIRRVERGAEVESDASASHGGALTAGMEAARGRWFVSLHSDTIVLRQDWLAMLLSRLAAHPRAAAIGSDKLETDPAWYRAMHRLWDTHRMKSFLRKAVGLPPNPRYQPRPWYPRTFCAAYRLDVIRQLDLTWKPLQGLAVGDPLYRGLVAAGYEAVRVPPDEMRLYVAHIGHATQLFARGGTRRALSDFRVRRSLRRVLNTDLARELLDDDSLDG
jgi:glycosyltransferase involved in cell wall biosynthesis